MALASWQKKEDPSMVYEKEEDFLRDFENDLTNGMAVPS